MDNAVVRKKEMAWLEKVGCKGIKVDFWGGDKQETMTLYEEVLSDADDHGLMCIFHGCTMPRGWERMYPNYVGSEAVLASENMYFGQGACNEEAFKATLHPFIRNTMGCMEFGGCFMNRILIAGYPGKYVIMAREDKNGEWHVAAINATKESISMNIDLPFFKDGEVQVYSDDASFENPALNVVKYKAKKGYRIEIAPGGGVIIEQNPLFGRNVDL